MLHLTAILCENGGTPEMMVRLKDTSMPFVIPHPFFEANHTKCPGLNPLDTKVIQWDIPKDGICLLELFGSISFKLSTFLQSCILVRKYHYVEKDPQAKQASMWHVMMLQQRYPHLLPTSSI